MIWSRFDLCSTLKTLNLSLLQFNERSKSENHGNRGKKRREVDRERNQWEEKRTEGVIVRVWKERKKQKREKKWENLLWERLNERKNIVFPKSEKDNIYRSYALCEREIVFQNFFLENNL